jgi:carboxymethylenebutenolidase
MPDDFAQDMKSLIARTELSRRGFVVAGTLATGFALAARPIQAQSVITTDTAGLTAGEVQIPAAGGTIPAYHAMPATGSGFPTVVVVQEIFGVHEHIKDVCRRFAKAAISRSRRSVCAPGRRLEAGRHPEIFKEVVSKVPDAQVMADTDAAVAWAASNGKATPTSSGHRLLLGRTDHLALCRPQAEGEGRRRLVRPHRRAGERPDAEAPASTSPRDLNAPVLGLYGGADTGIPNDTVEKMQAAIKAAGKPSEIVLYPDTPHAFHADYRPSYRKQQADDGWAKLQAWFKQNGVA